MCGAPGASVTGRALFIFPGRALALWWGMKFLLLLLAAAFPAFAQTPTPATPAAPGAVFAQGVDSALTVMSKTAVELKIHGAGLIAFIEGEKTEAWSSKMVVVGAMRNDPKEKDKGSNLLAIAYAKAAEMADTLKNSGHAGRPPMTGEFGWEGGLIRKVRGGYLLAAFSGGPSESDLKVSQAGLDALAEKF